VFATGGIKHEGSLQELILYGILRRNGAYIVLTVDIWAYVDVAFFTQNGSYIMKFCTCHVEHCVCARV